jgi:AraC-like DNA-binding protein
VTRVAHACGWANPSGFITAFTSIVGTTPGRYRAGQWPPGTPGAPGPPARRLTRP